MKKAGVIALCILLLLLLSSILFYRWAALPNLPQLAHNHIYRDSSFTSMNQQHSSRDTFTIMTYNLGYMSGLTNNRAVDRDRALFDDNLERALTLFQQQSPDIIAFQEIDYGSTRSYEVDQEFQIGEALEYPYRARAVNWDKRYVAFPYWPPSAHFGKIIGGQSVLSRFPIAEQQIDTLDRVDSAPFYYREFYLERLAQICTIRIDGQDVIVMNVHLEAFDRATRQKHMDRIQALYLQYSSKYPTIILGDFNSSPDETEATIKPLLNGNLNIGSADLDEENLHLTFRSDAPEKRLDYIFFSDRLELIKAAVVTQAGTISDHLPLQATFRLKDKN